MTDSPSPPRPKFEQEQEQEQEQRRAGAGAAGRQKSGRGRLISIARRTAPTSVGAEQIKPHGPTLGAVSIEMEVPLSPVSLLNHVKGCYV